MKLLVYQDSTLVGELFTAAQGVSFTYAPAYLQSAAYPISLSLPLTSEPFTQKNALPFFEGLLPEEQQRLDLSRFLHTSATSTMRLLKALAGECVGNLTLLDEDVSADAAHQENGYRALPADELELLLRPQSAERLRFLAYGRLSLAGAQAKFGLYEEGGCWYATQGLAPTTHIIKPASAEYESLLLNEFFMMRLAQACGLSSATTSIVTAGSAYGLAVERFDRLRQPGCVARLGQEDFCQALSVMPQEKYEADGGPGFEQLFQTTLLYASSPREDLRQLMRVLLFNYLIGNCDAHAKNFSLVRDLSSGSLRLAPAYDLVSTTFYGDALFRSMAMKIGEHSHIDRITTTDFELLSIKAGVSLRAISTEMALLREAIARALAEVTVQVTDELPSARDDAACLQTHVERELDLRSAVLR